MTQATGLPRRITLVTSAAEWISSKTIWLRLGGAGKMGKDGPLWPEKMDVSESLGLRRIWRFDSNRSISHCWPQQWPMGPMLCSLASKSRDSLNWKNWNLGVTLRSSITCFAGTSCLFYLFFCLFACLNHHISCQIRDIELSRSQTVRSHAALRSCFRRTLCRGNSHPSHPLVEHISPLSTKILEGDGDPIHGQIGSRMAPNSPEQLKMLEIVLTLNDIDGQFSQPEIGVEQEYQ